ncbi:MAG: signal peptidase I [Gammaproteobacteria bacterium]|nr:signal peptidase I [Gammaproteobacteria bacterium]
MARKPTPHTPFWIELPILVLIALVVAVVIKSFLIQAFFIPSGSMRHTLEIGDRVLVNKLSYIWSEPARGDVVVFLPPWGQTQEDEPLFDALARHVGESLGLRSPNIEDLIKRVIAVGGETVEIRDNQLLVDGVPIAEPYVYPGSHMPNFGPVTIPEGYVLVMGDNRDHSKDGRVFGPIPIDSIVGKAFIRIWPLDRFGRL